MTRSRMKQVRFATLDTIDGATFMVEGVHGGGGGYCSGIVRLIWSPFFPLEDMVLELQRHRPAQRARAIRAPPPPPPPIYVSS